MIDLTQPQTESQHISRARTLLGHLYEAIEALEAAEELTPLVVMNDETGDFATFDLNPDLSHLKALADELFSIVQA